MYELGKFMVDIAKLVFGGVILAGIMSEDINRQLLFSFGSLVVLAFALLGLYVISKNKEVKRYGFYIFSCILGNLGYYRWNSSNNTVQQAKQFRDRSFLSLSPAQADLPLGLLGHYRIRSGRFAAHPLRRI